MMPTMNEDDTLEQSPGMDKISTVPLIRIDL